MRSLFDKEERAVRRRTLKQVLHDGLTLRKVHRIIKFNQKTSSLVKNLN